MIVLPEELLRQCYRVLRQCDEFDGIESLRAVFVTPELAPFRDGLPEVPTNKERIERTRDYLLRLRLRDGRSILVLFLRALRERYDPNDERYELLRTLHEAVELELTRQEPEIEDDGALAYILLPHSMSRETSRGMAKIIQEAAREANLQPLVDSPRGAGNLKTLLRADVIVAVVADSDPDLLFSLGIAMTLREQIVLLAREGESLPRSLNNEIVVPYPRESGNDEDFKARLLDKLQHVHDARPSQPSNLVQQALPEAIRVALSDQTRLVQAPDVLNVLGQQHEEIKEKFEQLQKRIQAQFQDLNRSPAIDTTLLDRQIDDLRAKLSDMMLKRNQAENYLWRLARERDAMVDQIERIAHALEEDRALIVSPQDRAKQVFIPAALIVPGPPRASEEERRKAERFVGSFYMDVVPVTNAQFARFVEATGYETMAERQNRAQDRDDPTWRAPGGQGSSIDDRLDHPVVWIYRADALAYAKWARRRLPTRLEWERAARGAAGRTWPWGDEWVAGMCNLNSSGTTPVGAFEDGVSSAGCYDMVGNVWEWTADDLPGGKLLLMGGSWAEQGLKVGYKQLVFPEDGTDGATGFRCAMDVQSQTNG